MSKTALKQNLKPIRMKVTRIEEIFENSNPYTYTKPTSFNENKSIIKNYIYSNQKVLLTE